MIHMTWPDVWKWSCEALQASVAARSHAVTSERRSPLYLSHFSTLSFLQLGQKKRSDKGRLQLSKERQVFFENLPIGSFTP